MTEKGHKSTLRGRRFPQRWKHGTDPEKQRANILYLRQRAQAAHRDEPWVLSFQEWLTVWDGRLHLRGRASGALCMMRTHRDRAWSIDNVRVVSRSDQLQRKMREQERPLRNPGGQYVKRTYNKEE